MKEVFAESGNSQKYLLLETNIYRLVGSGLGVISRSRVLISAGCKCATVIPVNTKDTGAR